MADFVDALEEAVRARLQQNPGCLDQLLINCRGVRYVQAVHGDQPLAAGFDICASASPVPVPAAAPDAARWAALAAALLVAGLVVAVALTAAAR